MKTKNKYRIWVALILLIGFTVTGITENVIFSIAGLIISILFFMKMLRIRN